MKTATGVEGEGFANFVHVVVYCKLFPFFLKSSQLWKILMAEFFIRFLYVSYGIFS